MEEERYVPSREIVSAEARTLIAFGYFQGNNEQSFLDCYIKSYLMLNFEKFFKTNVMLMTNEQQISIVENYIKDMSKEKREHFARNLDWDLALVRSGLLEEMFNLFESKIKFTTDKIKDAKLSDRYVVNNKGEQETLSQLVLKAFGITEENNKNAYDYILNNATIQGFCLELRNAIAHNDEDDEFLKKQLAYNSNEENENKKYAERRYILRSDFLVELKCKYAKDKADLANKKFSSYEMIVKNETLLYLLGMLETACFADKENEKHQNIKQTIECESAKDNYDFQYRTKIENLEKIKGLNISAKECDKFSNQYDHNQDYLFEQKSAIFRLCEEISKNKDEIFGKFWAKKLQDENFDVNETVFNMIRSPCSGIATNMLYQVFTADKTQDITKDIRERLFKEGVIKTAGIDELFLKDGKLDKSRIETIVRRVRNAMQHGLYVDDFNDGIYIFGTTDSLYDAEVPIKNLGHLSMDNMFQISTMKKIEEVLLEAKIKDREDINTKVQKTTESEMQKGEV